MHPENSLHIPTSRDPRLTHLRPPVRTLLNTLPARQLPNSPTAPQPANQNDAAGCEDFIRGISGLVRATIQDSQNRAEKERLQKQKESNERLLKRAKAQPNFPAIIDHYQRACETDDAELSRINKALEQSTCLQFEKDLKAKFPSSSSADGKIQELENEIQARKNEASLLMERNQSLEAMLNSKCSKLEASVKAQAISQATQIKELKERMDHYQAVSSIAESKSAQMTSEMNNLSQRSVTLNTRVEQLWKSQNHCADSVAENTEKTKQQQEKLDSFKLQDIESIRRGLYELKTRLISLENSHVSDGHEKQHVPHIPHAELQRLTSRVQTLEQAPNPMPEIKRVEDALHDLTNLHAASDELHFSEKEDIKKELERQAQKSTLICVQVTNLSNEQQILSQTRPTVQQHNTLALSFQQTQKTVESLTVGLHSLETRYNNLSTETVVKNMVCAMQEMYPNAGQLTDQTSRLRGFIEKEVPPLLARIDAMDRKLQSHINTTRQDASTRLDELNRLKHDHSSLSQSLGPLWERFNSEGQLVRIEEYRTLRSDLESLAGTVAEYPSKDQVLTYGDIEVLQSKFDVLDQKMAGFRTSFITQLGAKADDDTTKEKMDKDRDHLLGQITSISTRTKELITSFADLEAATKTGRDDIVAVRDSVSQLQESILDKYKHLCKELDGVKTARERQASERSRSVSARGNPAPTTKQESPAPQAAEVIATAESSPALALREQKKKKKRPRPSDLANEEKGSATPSESPGSFSSPAPPSTPRTDETPESKRKKKKKKRKIEGPITID